MANALAAKYSTRSTGLRLDSATLMISMPSIRARSFPGHRLSVCILAMLAFSGCQSVPPEKAMDISEPGWTVRQGRATWKLKPTDPGISGELVVATHWNGRSVVRFNRASQPLIAVQSDTNRWQLQDFEKNKTRIGRGAPPDRIVWLQLERGLVEMKEGSDWVMNRTRQGPWRFVNDANGETLEGSLVTTAMPKTHRVQPGEQLLTLARKLGVRMDAIRAVNPGNEMLWFKPGNEINLPPPSPTEVAPP